MLCEDDMGEHWYCEVTRQGQIVSLTRTIVC
jgi:hypothetical protein